jgi:hypothetical protein
MRIKNTLRANQTLVFSIALLNRLKAYCHSAKMGLSAFARSAIEEKLDRLQAPIPVELEDMGAESLFAPVTLTKEVASDEPTTEVV